MRRLRFILLTSFALLTGLGVNIAAEQRPRLVILISIDQFRADYLSRCRDLFLPAFKDSNGTQSLGGFRYLEESGAQYVDAQHTHYPLFTGPGHAALLTGASPYKSGIISNTWYDRDRATNRYCVEDFTESLVGVPGKTNSPGASPRSLLVSAVGDELKMATGSQAKVWALGLKDRAAIFMGGHLANMALWFDENSGNWVTSSYYTNALPDWIASFNSTNPPPSAAEAATPRLRAVDCLATNVWTFSASNAFQRLWTPTNAFLHALASTNYKAFTYSPFANQFVLDFARELIERESLGKPNTAPSAPPLAADILAINLSSNDYVGHLYGPDSAEVLDITVETDRQLSVLFNWLRSQRLLDSTLLVLTADHGVSPLPKQVEKEARFSASIAFEPDVESIVNKFLGDRYGLAGAAGPARAVECNLYIDVSKLRNIDEPAAKIHEQVARYLTKTHALGTFAAYTAEQIQIGALPRTDVGDRVARSFYPGLSGDIVLVPQPYWIHLLAKSPYQSSHGSPFAYDTSVPLLISGPRIARGIYTQKVSTLDIAPTLSCLLGILRPSGSEGNILNCVQP